MLYGHGIKPNEKNKKIPNLRSLQRYKIEADSSFDSYHYCGIEKLRMRKKYNQSHLSINNEKKGTIVTVYN